MPKLLIAFSEANKKDRKAATSSQNLKKLIEKRVEKNAEDTKYLVITINTKMKLANVVSIINGSQKKLLEMEGVQSKENYTIDASKTRGRWLIEAAGESTKEVMDQAKANNEGTKKKKKKKHKKEEE